MLALEHEIPELCGVFEVVKSMSDIQTALQNNRNILQNGKRVYSDECRAILSAAEAYDIVAYRNGYAVLENTYAKTSLKQKREEYLSKLTPVAPQWAEAIRKRDGIHGDATLPGNIEGAWRWKQYYGIIEKIIEEPFSDLQKRSLSLSKEYRKVTAKFAEKSAWYHLLRKTEHDISMKQALQGWKLTVKKIGKGTGKNAPMYRAEARKLMVKCQEAVPAWIMPIGKALETLNPRTNKFDIIIIDEASQSDISSLAILYMGKKLVIVGDDKQVNPMAVGVQVDKMNVLKEMYIADKIPIYRCSKEEHYAQCQKEIEKSMLKFREPIEDNVRQYLDEHYKTPWNYNEVIRWLVIYRQGIDLVGEEWYDQHDKILRNQKRDFRFNAASAIRVRIYPEDSSEDIYRKLLHEIDEYGKGAKLKNRYIDISKLKNIGPFVNWRALMDD
ncbi:MAG TPA: hypothetical protein GXX74_09455 [Clostridiales bacterium]|nr:hypothetical protein [Clostridiales bacterium]